MRILVTDGPSYINSHVLDLLLARSHSVVTTVRSRATAHLIQRAYRNVSKNQLDCAIIDGKAHPDEIYDEAVVSDPPFDAVIHTCPTSADRGILLKSIMKNAPAVKRVVIGSAFSNVMLDHLGSAGKIYSEADWNPSRYINRTIVGRGPYRDFNYQQRSSESATNDFFKTENLNFTLTSCVLTSLIGPHYAALKDTKDDIPHQRITCFMRGYAKKACPPTNAYFFVDVRDAALSFVLAAEKEEAAGKRFLIAADRFCNKQIVEIMADEFPHLRDRLPAGEALRSGDFPERMPEFDNRRSVKVLGMTYRSLRESVVDNVMHLRFSSIANGDAPQPSFPNPRNPSQHAVALVLANWGSAH